MAEETNTNDDIVEVLNQFSSNQPSEQIMYEQYQDLIEKHTEIDE